MYFQLKKYVQLETRFEFTYLVYFVFIQDCRQNQDAQRQMQFSVRLYAPVIR